MVSLPPRAIARLARQTATTEVPTGGEEEPLRLGKIDYLRDGIASPAIVRNVAGASGNNDIAEPYPDPNYGPEPRRRVSGRAASRRVAKPGDAERYNDSTYSYDGEGDEEEPLMLTRDRDAELHSIPGVFRPDAREQAEMDREQRRRLGLEPFPGAPARSFYG